ncbi:hypothetical protein GCM10009836_73850 [Pseudonocardia ailaonensis]|uniref:DUF1990 domain-containing protein n=1 Tax=Pseudonocardia ailaonensis TaxID=367279 RepID=A0ABN2NU36_9PSEU
MAAVVRWPIGIAVVSWQYLWNTVAIHRTEEEGDGSDLPDPVPDGRLDDRVQTVEDGYGPLLHRHYSVRIAGGCSAEDLMGRMASDPNRWAPTGMSVFRRTRGASGSMTVGDELVVRLPGPWNGPVRVIASGPRGFRLATLRGHLEAGQIEFRAEPHGSGTEFVIESWARPGDRLSHLLYNRLLLAKEVQLVMWTRSCLGAVALSGGRRDGGLKVHTRRVALG